MIIKSLETERERRSCIELAKTLNIWFNESGLKAMEQDLQSEQTFVAVEKGHILGFITISSINERVLEILWMAVKSEFHRMGIGSEILHFIEKWAKARGYNLITVKTSGDLSYSPYDKTRNFYERNGFLRVVLIDNYPEWGEEVLIYVKCLSDI